MLKRFLFGLALVLCINLSATAQVFEGANVKALNTLYEKYDSQYQETRTKILEMANLPAWDRPDLSSNGMVFGVEKVLPNGYILVNEIDNNRDAANTTRASSLWTGGSLGLNLNGEGMTVGVWEAFDTAPNGGSVAAVLPTHVELNGRVTIRDGAILQGGAGANHGVHVAGTIAATGIFSNAKGMASSALVDSYDANNDEAEMALAGANGMVISNHSYGFNAQTIADIFKGSYSINARDWDEIAFNAPNYVIVKSAGNNGPAGTGSQQATNPVFGIGWNVLTGSSNSKNILVIGAANIIANGYQQPSDVVIASFSSRGPTDDGRIKPDVVGAGVNLYSPIGNTNNSYGFLSGTSMSAPNVAGSVALLQQHWRATLGGGTAWPRSATVRGLVIHTADEAGATPGPDYIFGYGMVNVERAVRMVSSVQAADGRNIIQQNTLNSGGNLSLNVVASGREPLKVTICWNDPIPSTTLLNQDNPTLNNYTSALVNDLDVRVTDVVTTNISQPWVMPYQVNQANVNMALAANNIASTGDNTKDNVEQIVIANPVPGRTYTINITHKGTLATPQQYTLIASGVGGTAVAASGATDNADSRIENVTLTGVGLNNNSNSAGACATYTDFTGLTGLTAIGAGQTVNLSVTLGTCNNAADKHVRVYIDWNGNGSFADAGEMVAQSATAVNGTGLGINAASIMVPNNVPIGSIALMRVVCVETTDVTTISPSGTYTRGETEDYLIRLAAPLADAGIAEIFTPDVAAGANCASYGQSVVVRIRNFGGSAITNVPVSVNVTGGTTATLTGTFSGTVPAFSQAFFTLPTTFTVSPSTNYNLSATTTLAGDADATNNSVSRSFSTSAVPTLGTLASSSCGAFNPTDLISLQASSATTGAGVFWYDASVGGNLVASGAQAYITKAVADALPTSNTLWASMNEFTATAQGPTALNLGAAATGGYAQATATPFFTVRTPFTISTARLFVSSTAVVGTTPTGVAGTPVGSITFSVIDAVSGQIVSSTVVPVTVTTATGTVFPVNIVFPRSGNFVLNIAYNGSFALFRNNGGTFPVNFYPINLGGVSGPASITGTSAGAGFYYWLYEMALAPGSCVDGSARTPLTLSSGSSTTATITQGATASFCDTPGASVTLNATETGAGLTYRWQRRTGTNPFADIASANASSFAATRQSATTLFTPELVDYRVIITRTDGCQATSAITTVTCNPQPFDLKIGSQTTAPPTVKPNFATGSTITISLRAYNGVTNTNQTYEWFRDGVSLGAATLGAFTLAVTQAGTYTARVTGPCFTQTSTPFVVTDVTPTATATALACGTNPRQLSATATAGQVFWYDAAVAGNLLATGTSTTRPNTETVNPYFVGINDFSGLVGSPANNTGGGASNFASGRMYFNANMPLEIDSATINATAVAVAPNNIITIIVTDRNFSNLIIATRTITLTAGVNRYKIGLYVPYAGNNFGLQVSSFGTGTTAYIQTVPGSVVFPYSIANVFSITGTNQTDQTAFYFYLYNIRIQAGSGAPATSRVNVPVQLRNLPTATLSGGGQLPAGQGLDLSVALTGTAPWSLVYNNGTANVSVANISSSPFIISTNTAGTFTLVSVSDASGCGSGTVSGTAVVTPAAPLVTSIDDAILAGVKVYPNPTNDVVNIEYYDAAKQVTATLVNANGATFGQLPLVNNGAFWSGILDLASLPSGVYYIQLNNGQELKVRAVIKP